MYVLENIPKKVLFPFQVFISDDTIHIANPNFQSQIAVKFMRAVIGHS